jgi:AraC-like DNA-binding protein/quercetin dioxygenase-like cupin family protein
MPKSAVPVPIVDMLDAVETASSPVTCRAVDYEYDRVVSPHTHTKHQLVYAVQGVMSVQAQSGFWVIPPSRGLWIPAGTTHAVRCIGEVHMRSLYVRQDAAPGLLTTCCAVGVSPLLRELIRGAAAVRHPYAPDSRDGRLMRLLLDELHALPVLPLHLPMPTDPRAVQICESLQRQPDDASTLADWADRLAVDAKTIQRVFAAQTGMTFGRWRQQARLLRALELIAGGTKIIDVALALGYDSPGAFATMFRKQFGQAPSQFFDVIEPG